MNEYQRLPRGGGVVVVVFLPLLFAVHFSVAVRKKECGQKVFKLFFFLQQIENVQRKLGRLVA